MAPQGVWQEHRAGTMRLANGSTLRFDIPAGIQVQWQTLVGWAKDDLGSPGIALHVALEGCQGLAKTLYWPEQPPGVIVTLSYRQPRLHHLQQPQDEGGVEGLLVPGREEWPELRGAAVCEIGPAEILKEGEIHG
jgi:hypothetical protein